MHKVVFNWDAGDPFLDITGGDRSSGSVHVFEEDKPDRYTVVTSEGSHVVPVMSVTELPWLLPEAPHKNKKHTKNKK